MKRFTFDKILWHGLPLLGLIIWGVLAVNNGLWYDEAYSAALVRQDFAGLIETTGKDVHSPFYYILLKCFYHLCGGGTNYWSLKVFSLLFAFGYLLIGKYWIKRLYDEKMSIYFMGFSVFMPAVMYHATNVRMYICGLFFFTVVALLAVELYRREDNGKPVQWVLFAIASACSVYCHTYQMIETLLVYGFFFLAILYKKQYKKLFGFFGSGVFVIITFLPWLKVTYRQMQHRITYTLGGEEAGMELADRLNTLATYGKEWFSTSETPIPLVMYLGMALTLILGYFAVNRMREQKDYLPAMGVGVIAITACVGTYLNCNVAPSFMGRYVFFAFGGLALLYAYGMRQITGKWMKVLVWVIALYCFVMQYRSELELDYSGELSQYQEFVTENVQEQDMIMCSSIYNLLLSLYYPDCDYMVYGYIEEWNPFPIEGTFTQWEQLEDVVGTLWYIGETPDSLGARYTYEKVLSFHHMYYDYDVYKMTPKEIFD